MAMRVSASGGVSNTRFVPLAIDQPAGTVNLAPPGVRRCVSAATCSGADVPAGDWSVEFEPDLAVALGSQMARSATAATKGRIRMSVDLRWGMEKLAASVREQESIVNPKVRSLDSLLRGVCSPIRLTHFNLSERLAPALRLFRQERVLNRLAISTQINGIENRQRATRSPDKTDAE